MKCLYILFFKNEWPGNAAAALDVGLLNGPKGLTIDDRGGGRVYACFFFFIVSPALSFVS